MQKLNHVFPILHNCPLSKNYNITYKKHSVSSYMLTLENIQYFRNPALTENAKQFL